MGSSHHLISPYGHFETATRPMMVACASDNLFRKLAPVLGHPEWIEDERFKDNPARVRNKTLIEGMIADILKTERRQHWFDLLNEAGVPCSPVNSIPEALDHPQAKALGIVQTDPSNDEIKSVGFPVSLNGKRPGLRFGAPNLGASTIDDWNER